VREVGISLRIGIAKALNIGRTEAKRLKTDGRCVREWDRIFPEAGVTSTNVDHFAHNEERRRFLQRRCSVGGLIHLGTMEQLLRGMAGARLRRVCHEAKHPWKAGGCRDDR